MLTSLFSPVSAKVQLYEDFAKSRAKVNVDDVISTTSTQEDEEKPKLKATGHVFQVDLMKLYKRARISSSQSNSL